MLQRLPPFIPHRIQSLYVYKGKLARAYLCCNLHDKAEPILSSFAHQRFRFADVNSFLLDGLYLGGYYDECIRTFQSIQAFNRQRLQSRETPVKIQYTAYSAVLRSHCKLFHEEGVSQTRALMQQDAILPRECDYFALCEFWDTLPKWRETLRKVASVCRAKGVSLSPEQWRRCAAMRSRTAVIAARAKEIQFGEGVHVIASYCSQYDSNLDFDVHHNELRGFPRFPDEE